MTRTCDVLAFLLVAAMPARAQDWHQQLKADLVTIANGKMTYNDVGLYKLDVPGYQPAQI
jgi:hypothetical protein